jgi:hypothetical protein
MNNFPLRKKKKIRRVPTTGGIVGKLWFGQWGNK